MKKLTITIITLFLLLTFLYCGHNSSPSNREKLFHQNKLSQLSLEQIDNFWKNDTIISISDVTGVFSHHTGFIKGLHYSSSNHAKNKYARVAVSVFKSKNIAIDAMEERIEEVSMKIFQGDAYQKIKDKWWWGIYLNFQRGVFINKWNTIVEVALNYDYANDDSIRILLEDTAIEIANRVDALSNYSYFNRLTKGQNIVN